MCPPWQYNTPIQPPSFHERFQFTRCSLPRCPPRKKIQILDQFILDKKNCNHITHSSKKLRYLDFFGLCVTKSSSLQGNINLNHSMWCQNKTSMHIKLTKIQRWSPSQRSSNYVSSNVRWDANWKLTSRQARTNSSTESWCLWSIHQVMKFLVKNQLTKSWSLWSSFA